jgi:hypothetical protein
LNPFETSLVWDIDVGSNAVLGARDITVINPNNTSKTATNAIVIVDDPNEDSVRCSTSGTGRPGFGTLLFALLVMAPRIRRLLA